MFNVQQGMFNRELNFEMFNFQQGIFNRELLGARLRHAVCNLLFFHWMFNSLLKIPC